ncbi:MAG: UbiX family flavin prenyltransferase [Candidatus Micrarchaeota archaeon]
MRLVLAITGASGISYGLSLARSLKGNELHIIVTKSAKSIIDEELGNPKKILLELSKLGTLHDENSFHSPLASGSFLLDAMVICPCSMKTLSAIANGYSSNLVTRAADVALKEHRKLILVPRETPLSPIHLENMLKLSKFGAVILPASPAFYGKPKSLDELIDFIVGRVLDQLGIKNSKYKRWKHA